jgi:hypothetical protein
MAPKPEEQQPASPPPPPPKPEDAQQYISWVGRSAEPDKVEKKKQ